MNSSDLSRFEVVDMTRLKAAARAGKLDSISSAQDLVSVLEACQCVRRDLRHILSGVQKIKEEHQKDIFDEVLKPSAV